MLKRWIKAWRAQQDAENHRRGYQWAAEALLKGRGPSTIEWALEHQQWEDNHPFDQGIREAINDWCRRVPIGKNPTH